MIEDTAVCQNPDCWDALDIHLHVIVIEETDTYLPYHADCCPVVLNGNSCHEVHQPSRRPRLLDLAAL